MVGNANAAIVNMKKTQADYTILITLDGARSLPDLTLRTAMPCALVATNFGDQPTEKPIVLSKSINWVKLTSIFLP